jgi:hypothetical protein
VSCAFESFLQDTFASTALILVPRPSDSVRPDPYSPLTALCESAIKHPCRTNSSPALCTYLQPRGSSRPAIRPVLAAQACVANAYSRAPGNPSPSSSSEEAQKQDRSPSPSPSQSTWLRATRGCASPLSLSSPVASSPLSLFPRDTPRLLAAKTSASSPSSSAAHSTPSGTRRAESPERAGTAA